MESDLSLIKKIQSEDNQACLESLIQRHSGIYVYVVDQYTKNPNSIIDRETIMQEKDTLPTPTQSLSLPLSTPPATAPAMSHPLPDDGALPC